MKISNNTSTVGTQPLAEKRPAPDYNAFLQMMLAQMKNQDPTNPMDANESMTQLAQFSEVEQAIKTNKRLDEIYSAMSFSGADGFIGRTVTDAGGRSGKISSLLYTDQGMVAKLADGTTIPIGPGVTIA